MDIQQERQPYSLKQALKECWELIVLGFWLLVVVSWVVFILLLPFMYYSGVLAAMHYWFEALWVSVDLYFRENPALLLGIPYALIFALAIPQWIKEADERRKAH